MQQMQRSTNDQQKINQEKKISRKNISNHNQKILYMTITQEKLIAVEKVLAEDVSFFAQSALSSMVLDCRCSKIDRSISAKKGVNLDSKKNENCTYLCKY